MYRIIGADGKEYGPISAEQLRQWIVERRAIAATPVLAEGATEWKPLSSIPEFSLLFAAPATPAPAPLSTQRTNAFATTSLVLGIIAITIGMCCCYGLPFNILGLIFGIIAMIQIRRDPQRFSGQGLAIAGLVLSILSLALMVLLVIAMIFGSILQPGGGTHVYRL